MTASIHPDTDKLLEASLNPAQVRSVRSILNRLCDLERYQPMEFSVEDIATYPSFSALVIRGTRTDCDKYSPRAVCCNLRAHFFIGPRGARKLAGYSSGLNSDDATLRARASLLRART